MKLFVSLIAMVATLIALLLTVVLLLVLTETPKVKTKTCILMAVQIVDLGKNEEFDVPEEVYSEYQKLCHVDLRPTEEGGKWF